MINHHSKYNTDAIMACFRDLLQVVLFVALLGWNVPRGMAFSQFQHRKQPNHLQIQHSRLDRKQHSLTTVTTVYGITPTIAAGTAITSSALMGMWMERQKPNTGIVTSLMVSSLLFSKWAPSSHFLYDLCWNTFLPASLALLLLGTSTKSQQTSMLSSSSSSSFNNQQKGSIRNVVLRLALPFGLASIGSLIGCMVSFLIFRRPSLSSPSTSSILLGLSSKDAAWASACLSASFVGGSVNFLATAAWIASQTTTAATTTTSSLLSAMTAADLIIMAIYFVCMAVASQSIPLQRWFHREMFVPYTNATTATTTTTTTTTVITQTKQQQKYQPQQYNSNSKYTKANSHSFHIPTAIVLTSVAYILVHIGQWVEQLCAPYVAGMACAFLSIITPWISRWMPSPTIHTAPVLSQFCFYLLFAAVGRTANLTAALQSGPVCLLFVSVALFFHGVILLGVGRYVPGHRPLMDYLIASNAAIGGPTTAATFCGTLSNNNSNTRALTMAATFWGVFGYAIGTTVGIGMYRFLMNFV